MNLSLVAPASGFVPASLAHCCPPDPEPLIAQIQRFRGRIYAQDETIPLSALDAEGRHYGELDYCSWHVVARDAQGQLSGVMRLPIYAITTSVHTLLGQSLERLEPHRKHIYHYVMHRFLDQAAAGGYRYVAEPGGWAVDKARADRQTTVALAAACWALGEFYGHYVAAAPVAGKHPVADLLKRLGGINPLDGTPNARFYDAHLRCDTELIFLRSNVVNAQFAEVVETIRDLLITNRISEPTSNLSLP